MSEESSVCCIIGAGYSFVGGLPLAKDLFTVPADAYTEETARRFEVVWSDYRKWKSENPDQHDEKYLLDLYRNFFDRPAPPFEWAVELIGAVLASPPDDFLNHSQPRYTYRLTQPSRCPAHKQFWKTVFKSHSNVSVVTTNYDILIERSLRHRQMKRGFGPGFFYGGIQHPQILKGSPQPFSRENRQKEVKLEGNVKLSKLHGSLNWSLDHSGHLDLYQDLRPAFRGGGDAAIVPPLPEKSAPEWLDAIWNSAEESLATSSRWIVCGYSLPEYDEAIWNLLARSSDCLAEILVLDPQSHHHTARWKQVAPGASITVLPGLPEGVDEISRFSSANKAQ